MLGGGERSRLAVPHHSGPTCPADLRCGRSARPGRGRLPGTAEARRRSCATRAPPSRTEGDRRPYRGLGECRARERCLGGAAKAPARRPAGGDGLSQKPPLLAHPPSRQAPLPGGPMNGVAMYAEPVGDLVHREDWLRWSRHARKTAARARSWRPAGELLKYALDCSGLSSRLGLRPGRRQVSPSTVT